MPRARRAERANAQGVANFWESGNLAEHVSLISRQVERSLADEATRELARKIVAHEPDRGGVIRAWGNAYVLPAEQRTAPSSKDAEECAARTAITRIWNFVVRNWTYIQDPPEFDLFAHIRYGLDARAHALELEGMRAPDERVRNQLLAHIAVLRSVRTLGAGDCFPEGTLLLRSDGQLIPVEAIRPGDRIWGENAWTTVEAVCSKGVLPITNVGLNNGSWVPLTEDHKVYVGHCPRHSGRVTTPPCDCPWAELQVERIRVADLERGMRFCQPERVAFGSGDEDPELSWIDGVYLADGWSEEYRFFVSGKDGHPKEAQKERVRAIAEKHGAATRWHERYLAVNDPAWTQRLRALGQHAPLKRARTLDLGEAQAGELLRGIMADSGRNSNGPGATFTSTSRLLATQVRVLHRMFGQRTGYSYIENHGGLGTHPIHRVFVRDARADRVEKRLRVKEIVRGVNEAPVWDLKTSDHKVYLPEHDVTVSNCDDAVIILGALLKAAGFKTVRARVVSVDDETWEHVYTMVGVPRVNAHTLVALDPTVKGATPGWEYDRARTVQDFIL